MTNKPTPVAPPETPEEEVPTDEDVAKVLLGSPLDDDGFDEEDDDDTDGLILVEEPVLLANGQAHISLHLTVPDVTTLDEALDAAATTLGRFGMDSFYVVVTEPVTEKRYLVNGGRVLREPGPDEQA